MNGEGSYMAPEVVVVGRQFTEPHQFDLTIVRKKMAILGRKFTVTNADGNIMFKVKGKALSLHSRRVLLDADGNPIVSFQRKMQKKNSSSVVTVYPHVDYAFIVALVVILEEINEKGKNNGGSGGAFIGDGGGCGGGGCGGGGGG